MIIKKVGNSYLSKIYALGKKEFSGEYWFTKKFLKTTIERKGLALGAFKKNELIGVIFVEFPDMPKAWIYFFIVDKSYRRNGVGSKLLKEIEKRLPKGYFLMFTDFEDKDTSAKRFYIKNGFKKSAKIKDWFGENTYGLIYCKKINKKE